MFTCIERAYSIVTDSKNHASRWAGHGSVTPVPQLFSYMCKPRLITKMACVSNPMPPGRDQKQESETQDQTTDSQDGRNVM